MEIISFFAREYPFYIMGTILIFLGISLLIIKKNLLVAVLSLEVAFNGLNLFFVTVSHYLGDIHGKMIVLVTLTVAAGSFAIGLILIVSYYRLKRSLSMEELDLLGEKDEE